MKRIVNFVKNVLGPTVAAPDESRLLLAHERRQREIIERYLPLTMIGVSGLLANLDAIDYLSRNQIRGSVVECGVWRGGSMGAMAERLLDNNDDQRDLFLFDTFAGMTTPTEHDDRSGVPAMVKFRAEQREAHNEWCFSPLETV